MLKTRLTTKTSNNLRQAIDNVLIPATASLLGVIICIRHSSIINIPLPYITAMSSVLLTLSLHRQMRVCYAIAGLLLYYAATIVIHPYPELLIRIGRFVAFAVALLLFSPLLISHKISIVRDHIFRSIILTMSVMVLISFCLWIYSIILNYDITDSFLYSFGFRGIFDMGMTLSPVAGVTAIVGLYYVVVTTTYISRAFWFLISTISIILCVAAGSRIAVLGLTIALLIETLLMRKQIPKIITTRCAKLTLVVTLVCIAITFPSAIKMLAHKNLLCEQNNSFVFSRQELWSTRFEEITSSPLTGIGYANEFPRQSWQNHAGELSYLEPGSSWLSLISYGGIIGMVVFCYFLIVLIQTIKQQQSQQIILPIALLTFLFINGITEGWLLFAGALMFPIFWLSCSATFKLPITHTS